jgi:hypothetical protein
MNAIPAAYQLDQTLLFASLYSAKQFSLAE